MEKSVHLVSAKELSLTLLITLFCAHTGKLYDGLSQGVSAEFMEFPNEAKIIDLATAASYTLALTENGDVYYWGRNQVA